MSHILIIIVLFPLFGSSFSFIFPNYPDFVKKVTFFIAGLSFYLSTFLLICFDKSTDTFQFISFYQWGIGPNTYFGFGVDGISLFFVILTTFLTPLTILAAWNIKHAYFGVHYYFSIFLFIEGLTLIIFTTLDLFIFYVFFESVLIPMFIIIGIWGSRERKVRAGFLFFLYTLLGSLFMLIGILFIYLEVGTTDYLVLCCHDFNLSKQKFLWLAFFVSFSVKIPIIPVHVWLPEAHVEAPTGGSVMLAGIILKLGTYGLLRFSLPLFPLANFYYRPFIFIIASVAVVYTSITALRQTDIKRVVAYASVAHINITIVGLFSFTIPGIEGSIFQMLSHGVVSGALFFCIGVLYDRHHSRLIQYYSGLVQTIPLFTLFFLAFTIANIALPGTSSFVGEFLILSGILSVNFFTGFFCATSLVLGGGYSLWLFNRVSYGSLKSNFARYSVDLNKKEYYILLPLLFLVLFIGVFPNLFFEPMHLASNKLILQLFT